MHDMQMLQRILHELYGEEYLIAVAHLSYSASLQMDFMPRDFDKPPQRIYVPYYLLDSGDTKNLKDYLDPYLIHLTIDQCCDIIREALKKC
jgi:hypothetical protein